ncbi:MAG: MlaD family protein [Verrucomicrobiota bacterium]
MSKKANPTAVGIFVSGAVIFIITAVVLIGTGSLFEKKERFLVYFQTAANGLTESSDVRLGGVKVGRVVKIQVQLDPQTHQQLIPVVIEISANRLANLTGDTERKKADFFTDENIQASIDQGLRARMTQVSVLTGQLIVELDFLPNSGPGFVFEGPPIAPYPQIPTVKGQIEQVFEKLAASLENISKIDIGGLVSDANKLVNNLDDKVNEIDTKAISDNANAFLKNADALVTDQKLKEGIANFSSATEELKSILASVNTEDINTTLEKAASAMTKADIAAGNIANLTNPNADIGIRIQNVLSEIDRASRSIRELSDYLQRNPNAIITGKKRP